MIILESEWNEAAGVKERLEEQKVDPEQSTSQALPR
jgi:hypothetical protein